MPDGNPTQLDPVAGNEYLIPIDISPTECPLITVTITSLNGAFEGGTSTAETHQFSKYFSGVHTLAPVA